MAGLANRRAPWLATIGGFLAWHGFAPLALYVGRDALYYDIARRGSNAQWIDLAQRWNDTGAMGFLWHRLWAGHGPALPGIALWRAWVIPAWAALCLIASRLPAPLFLLVLDHVAVAIILAGVVLLFFRQYLRCAGGGQDAVRGEPGHIENGILFRPRTRTAGAGDRISGRIFAARTSAILGLSSVGVSSP